MKIFKTLLVIATISVSILIGIAVGAWNHRPISRWMGLTTGTAKVVGGSAAARSSQRKILYWWDPMVGPSSISKMPGISSMGMKLIPVYGSTTKSAPAGRVRVNPVMAQNMGIQTATVREGVLRKTIRTVGYLQAAAPNRWSINLRTDGWIGKLYATTNGTAVRKGQKLFTLYSPAIVTAEEELIAARKSAIALQKSRELGATREAEELLRSIEHRLKFLGVNGSQIQNIQETLHAQTYITFYSPSTGTLTDVQVEQKSFVKSGTTIMRIENLETVWLNVRVLDNQLSWIRRGERVTSTFAALPGRTFTGKLIFIDRYENSRFHNTTVRIVLNNRLGQLRPGMYALAEIHTTPVPRCLLVPRVAVMNMGTGKLVFVEVSPGHFDPVAVKTGLRGGRGVVQVFSGLKKGQKVVTNGQFLIDVESQLNQIKARFIPQVSPKRKAGS
ncbi:MAG: efflux RND transporter periplasmic adaptor subunit [Phycisphaerae bacterium]|nr:efflux RND transporter periplasmic adaptor subunit [Phycisphaerae bacterium]